jgi:hypothetical protein
MTDPVRTCTCSHSKSDHPQWSCNLCDCKLFMPLAAKDSTRAMGQCQNPENRYECNSCGALYGDNQTVGCPHNSKTAPLRPQSAEQFYEVWRKSQLYHRVGPLPEWRPEEAFAFAEAYARAARDESRKHNWKCVAPENGYYRWQCQNPGCSETAPYPSVLPDSSCAYSAALPVGESTTRNSEVLADFVKYCREHPEQRFWQALRNWSEYPFLLVSDGMDDSAFPATYMIDTFPFEGRRHEFKK